MEGEHPMDVVTGMLLGFAENHGDKGSNNSFYFHVLSYLENGLEL